MVQGNIRKRENYNNVMVVFTKEGETADSYIEKTINNIGKKIDVCVVISDALEQQLIFQRGAGSMSSMEFYFEVEEINTKTNKKVEKKYSEQRNLIEDRIEKNILEKLEEIRRCR